MQNGMLKSSVNWGRSWVGQRDRQEVTGEYESTSISSGDTARMPALAVV